MQGLKIFAWLLVSALMLIKSAWAEHNSSRVSEAQRLSVFSNWIDGLAAKQEISGTFLFARDGKVVFSKAVGKVHPDKEQQLTLESAFNLGSISKQFTAFAIMLLKQQGKLSYDDRVQRIFADFPYPEIRVRHLLNHTSGLIDYEELTDSYWQKQAFTNLDMLQLFVRYKPELEFSSGSRFEYSNTGYVLLAAIVEKLSGLSLEEFSSKYMFQPLNMQHTRIFTILSEDKMVPNRVYGQHKDQLNDLYHIEGVTGDGAVYSSVLDLLKWHQALRTNRLLPKSEKQQAFSPTTLDDGSLVAHGFGWFIGEKHTSKVTHDGGWLGFRNLLSRNGKNDELLIFLTNNDYGAKYRDIRDHFMGAVDADLVFLDDGFKLCAIQGQKKTCQ